MLGSAMEQKDKMDRVQIAKEIEEKLAAVSKLRKTLEHRKQTLGCSIDDQILLAETECLLTQEEVTLLSLQEQHWERAAFWDESSREPHFKSPIYEVLHSHIVSLKEKGIIPAIHATEYAAVENGILLSTQGNNKPSIPTVEWAHETTELLTGDRLLEVNGCSVIGKDSNEVTQLLCFSSAPCRVIFLRPMPVSQLLKDLSCKEVFNLRQELTSVVSQLNNKIVQNKSMTSEITKLKSSFEELRTTHHMLKMQLYALQKKFWLFFNIMEKKTMHGAIEIFKNTLLSSSVRLWTFSCLWPNELRYYPVFDFSDVAEIFPRHIKSISWSEILPFYSKNNSSMSTEEKEAPKSESEEIYAWKHYYLKIFPHDPRVDAYA